MEYSRCFILTQHHELGQPGADSLMNWVNLTQTWSDSTVQSCLN